MNASKKKQAMLSRAVLITCAALAGARNTGADFVASGDDGIRMRVSDIKNEWYSNGVDEEDMIEEEVNAVGMKQLHDRVVNRGEVDAVVEAMDLRSKFYDCQEGGILEEEDEGYMTAEEHEDHAIAKNNKVASSRPRRLQFFEQLTAPTRLRMQPTVAKGPGFRAPFSIPRTLPAEKRSHAAESKPVRHVVWRDQAIAEPLEEVQYIENCLADKSWGQRLSESLSKMKWKKCLDPQTKEGTFAIGYLLWLFAVVASTGVTAEFNSA